MATYHISEDGKARVCRASSPDKCTAKGLEGSPAAHGEFATSQDAARFAEEVLEKSFQNAHLTGASREESSKSIASFTPLDKSTLSESERAALDDYQGWNFDRFNDSLRSEFLPFETKDFQDKVKAIDELIERHVVPEDTTLYRSLKTGGGRSMFFPKVGETLEDHAYMSCSMSKDFQKFLEDEWYEQGQEEEEEDDSPCPYDAVIQIDVPKGSPGLVMPQESWREKKEQEVLLPRDSQIEIYEIGEPDANGLRILRGRIKASA